MILCQTSSGTSQGVPTEPHSNAGSDGFTPSISNVMPSASPAPAAGNLGSGVHGSSNVNGSLQGSGPRNLQALVSMSMISLKVPVLMLAALNKLQL